MKLSRTALLILSILLSSQFPVAEDEGTDANELISPDTFKAMDYRLIGPFRGGRVTAVTGIAGDIFTYYMGTTGGGVWKTGNGGQTWNNVSDGSFEVGSIGAIAVAPSDQNVVYVGTGSGCPRGNISPGIGVYKSTDSGKTWKHAGLREAGLIGRIHVHPADPDLVYVAVLGNIFGPNEQRGVYRSKDGGGTWSRILFVDESTGAVDLSMDPSNPRILYAAMWRAERKPWTMIDGGESSGLFRSVDAGETWTQVEGGLPDGVLGRIGVAISPANPQRIWVILESQDESKGGLYRSDDGGKSFERINRDHELRQRAWYYNHVIADPVDENTVYIMNGPFLKSIDAGKSFQRVRVPHGDNHDLWVNPANNRIWINGNDGGANVSYDSGETWSTQLNQPTAEFYRVTVDNQFPYRVYGAQQDNSTISVPSWPPGGITPEENWFDVGGGESGHIAVDPANPDIIYAGNYIGQITRLDRKRWHMRDVVAYPQMHDGVAPRDIVYRFQWNAPIRISPHDPKILYHTSQYVHRSTDEGQSWEVISPDLTSNKDEYHDIPGGPVQHDHTGVELYTTIFAFEESPHNAGEFWAGSDDGLVHLSTDNGKTWTDITPPRMPEEGTVNTIELSAHAPGRAIISVYRYRRSDFRPYVFLTDDYGKSWKLLTDGRNGIPENHFVRVVREDPRRKGLLYAGSEFGMYISFDEGEHWQEFQLNLPFTPITDLAVHRNDLVVGTQGRSFWILDDLTPLHQLTKETQDSPFHLFQPRLSYRTQLTGYRGDAVPDSPDRGVMVFYYLKEVPEQEVTLEIQDHEGNLIEKFSSEGEKDGKLKVEAGMNRWVWDLRYPEPDLLEKTVMSLSRNAGALAPPGQYKVKMSAGDWSQTQGFEILKDPRWEVSDEDLKAQFDLASEIGQCLSQTHAAIRRIRSVRKQASEIASRATEAGYEESIQSATKTLDEKLTLLEEELIQTKTESGQDPINYPPKLDNQFAYLHSIVIQQDARPTEGAYRRFNDLQEELRRHLTALDKVLETDLTTFNQLLDQQGVPRIIQPVQGK